MQNNIPAPDILPLPAPVWLFMGLLIFTFTLHVVFMNLLFGGTFLSLVSYIRGKNDSNHAHLSQKIYKFLPVVIAFTVNFGVAPLLFVQVLYGNLLYSSSILIAYYWFAVIPLVITGYYGAYLLRFKWERVAKFRLPMVILIAAIFAAIAFIFVNNLTLVQTPGTWISHYFINPKTGTLNWENASVYPRYLHMFLGAVAVSGVWLMIIGVRRKTGGSDWSEWAVRYGSRIFIISTIANILVGIWFLLVLPPNVLKIFIGGSIPATALLVLSLLLTAAAFYVIHKAPKSENPGRFTYMGAGILLSVLVIMLILRQMMRAAYLDGYFSLGQLEVLPQWGPFAFFACVFLLILAPTAAWMIKVILNMNADKK